MLTRQNKVSESLGGLCDIHSCRVDREGIEV